MLNQFITELPGAILGALVAWLLAFSIGAYKTMRNRIKTRHIRAFWRPFVNKEVDIVISEYPPQPTERSSRFVKYWGSRWLISKGMAVALAHLLEFCGNQIISRDKISIVGAKSGHPKDNNIIVLGSAASNPFTEMILKQLEILYDIPYKFFTDTEAFRPEEKGILVVADNYLLEPKIDTNGFGYDYGLIIKAKYRRDPERWVVVAAGCHMWGTEAAAFAITRAEVLNIIAQFVKMDNFALVIKTNLANSRPLESELHINNRYYVTQLSPKNI